MDLLYSFNNIGFSANGRSFPGFPANTELLFCNLAQRDAIMYDLKQGDLLSIDGLSSGEQIGMLVVDQQGNLAPGVLGLDAPFDIAQSRFDHAPLTGWFAALGLDPTGEFRTAAITGNDTIIVLKAAQPCTVWAIRPATAEQLVTASKAASVVTLRHQPLRTDDLSLIAPVLGEIREEFTVQLGTAMAYEVRQDEFLQIIDVEGQQCSDFMAFRSGELERGRERMIDGTATRSMVRRAYPGPGLLDKFFDQDMRPMLNVVQDTCGRHDMFGLACTARGYEERGFPGHLNCSDNISGASAPYGVQRRRAWPAINFFWNTWIDPHQQNLLTEESWSRPGDYIAMRAMDDLLCVSTACPDDLDPINGWNPTDIHVRIYKPDTTVRRAVAYREKENAPMSISQESAFHPRTSALTTLFAPARDLWLPTAYPSLGTVGEYWACRERVTLQDMSSIRKYDIIGPDAEKLLQQTLTRDLSRLAIWRGTYALICDDTGSVIDDGTLFRLGQEIFRWCCGSEESARVLQKHATATGMQVRIHGLGSTMPNLALQGPRSREVLEKIVFTQPHVPPLDQLKWFGVTVARLNDREGIPFMLSRSGYTGELGYELFCSRSDAVALWDGLMEAGEEFGIAPMGGAALEIIRIEAGLAAADAEFAPGVDAFESGLGFAVALDKTDFIGKEALERRSQNPRWLLKGLLLDGDDMPASGAAVFAGERQVGVIASATRSPSLERTIASARLAVEHAEDDTVLEAGQLDGRMKRISATVTSIPFIDPNRSRARA